MLLLAQVTGKWVQRAVLKPFGGYEHTSSELSDTTISPGPDGGCGGTRVQREPFDGHIVEEHGHSFFGFCKALLCA